MSKKLLLVIIGLGLLSNGFGQKSLNWKQYLKQGDQLFQQGNYAEAAENFENAYKKKKKQDIIFKAGESYYILKDYRKAAAAYEVVKNENKDFPLVGLKYARSLKQDGQYRKAKEAYQAFFSQYSGEGKSVLEEIINMEVKGCDLAGELAQRMDKSIELKWTGTGINTKEQDFGPFLASNGSLYYSSTSGGSARILNAQKTGAEWDKGNTPENFPVIANQHFCNGVFNSDGSRFYFNICQTGNQGWDERNLRCEIYYIQKGQTGGWSKPQPLSENINRRGVTSLQPYVFQEQGMEFLYFASNRDGGRGGLDIWYASRDLGADDGNFSNPVNLGPIVNTIGDEMTAYYDAQSSTLFFSSNGHLSIGGFDILKSRGSESSWASPENIGLPYNSSADDYGYKSDANQGKIFLVSNRPYGGTKNSTRDSDIFVIESSSSSNSLVLKGNVYNAESGNLMETVAVTLFEKASDGSENTLVQRDFTGGSYTLDILPNRNYRVEVNWTGFAASSYDFSTTAPDVYTYGQPVFLQPSLPPKANVSETAGSAVNRPKLGPPGGAPAGSAETYATRGKAGTDKLEFVTKAPRYQGEYFKIQIIATKKFNPDDSAYSKIRDLGRFDTEELVSGKKLTRVLIADFFSQEEAMSVLQTVKEKGFKEAFIVRYLDGERYESIRP